VITLQESTAGEYFRSTTGKYCRRVLQERSTGEYFRRALQESTTGEYYRRVLQESATR
jgi:hypothetical protein